MVDDSCPGFTEGKLCLANLAAFHSGITALVDERRPTDTINLDLCKSFGTLPHNSLVFKLESLGFDEHLVDKKLSG